MGSDVVGWVGVHRVVSFCEGHFVLEVRTDVT